MRKVASVFIRSFVQGLAILSPIAITIYAIFYVFISLDELIPGVSDLAPGVGFAMVIAIITIVGYFGTRFFFGRWLVEGFGFLLEHTPGIKHIYSSIKDFMESFLGDKKKFNNPVWVRTSTAPEIWRIGFLTQKTMQNVGLLQDNMVAVYLPHSYAISGWVIVVDRSEVKEVIGMNAAEAMKFAVSGGITGKPNDVED